jgi:hypothetical protein
MFKLKIKVAAVVTLASSMVFANDFKNTCMQGNIGTPCNSKAWELSASALYLQPSFGGDGLGYSSYSNYGGADNQGVIITTNGINNINNVTPEWDFGFQLEGVYYYNAGNDVRLNWSHLNENVNGTLPLGSLFSGSVDGFYAGNIEIDTKWDEVNLEIGRRINLNDNILLHIFTGLEYASIKNTFTNHPKLFLTSGPYFTSIDDLSFTGFGPRVGMDFSYMLGMGVGIYAKMAGSLLVGTGKQDISGYQDVVNAHYGRIIFGIPNYRFSYDNMVVPELEGKVGLTYDYSFTNSSLGLDLGYSWTSYIHAIASYTGVGIVASSVGVPTTTNFDLNGVFLTVRWKGYI